MRLMEGNLASLGLSETTLYPYIKSQLIYFIAEERVDRMLGLSSPKYRVHSKRFMKIEVLHLIIIDVSINRCLFSSP